MRTPGILVAVTIAFAAAACGGRAEKSGAGARASPSAPASTIASSSTPGATGVPNLICEVVMVDPANRRIVVRTPSAAGGTAVREKSLAVSGPALAALPGLKPKDQVAVVCEESAFVPRSPGPAGGNDGIGPVATGEELDTCTTVSSLTKIAAPLR
jgi:hypothetical protein